MKIVRIRMVNFIGVFDGTGQTEIEIVFPQDADARMILLLGRNGSGKSTIMSHLQPFWESKDDRATQILEGEDGLKEIDIQDGDILYKIRHVYNGKTNKVKSFITKVVAGHDDEELNPNGGVRAFVDKLAEVLDITNDFFKVGRIGSNVNSFVEMNSSDRKKYISRFLPNIDPYLEAHKVVGVKHRDMKKLVAFLSDELSKLDTLDNLQTSEESSENALESIRTTLASTQERISAINAILQEIDPDGTLKANPVNPYMAELSKLQDTIIEDEAKLTAYIEQYPTFSELDEDKSDTMLTNFNAQLSNNESKSELLNQNKHSATEDLDRSSSDLARKEREMSNNSTNINGVPELEEMLEKATAELAESNSAFEEMSSKYDHLFGEFTHADIMEVSSKMDSICESISNLKASLSETTLERIREMYSAGNWTKAYLEGIASRALRRKESEESLVNRKNVVLSTLESQIKQAEILEKRPSNCRIDTCAFITSALRYKDAETTLKEETLLRDSAKVALREATEELEVIDEMETFFDGCERLRAGTKKFLKLTKFEVFKHFDSIETFAELALSPPDVIRVQFSCKEEIRFVLAKVSIKEIETNIETITSKLEAAKASTSLAVSIKKDVDSLKNSVAILQERVDNFESEANDLRASTLTINRKKQIVQDVKDLLVSCRESKTRFEEVNELFSDAEEQVKRVKELLSELKTLDEAKTADEAELNIRQATLDEVRLKITRYNEYTTRKEDLEDKLLILQNIRMATDPVKGIPITMIDDYLVGVEQVANRLLDMSYNGGFRINFNLNEKEFLIEVQKENGNSCGDVLIASQGQQAMTSTTLSFAIYQQALGRYNILCLDEIDATLDEVNRRVFLEIIRKQIDSLGLEQVFIISHNDEFFSEQDVGLILLPGHTAPLEDELFTARKTIIANFDE